VHKGNLMAAMHGSLSRMQYVQANAICHAMCGDPTHVAAQCPAEQVEAPSAGPACTVACQGSCCYCCYCCACLSTLQHFGLGFVFFFMGCSGWSSGCDVWVWMGAAEQLASAALGAVAGVAFIILCVDSLPIMSCNLLPIFHHTQL
jgi:hypothetical protein